MQNNLIDKKIVDQKLAACGISDMEEAGKNSSVWKWAFPDLPLLK